MARICASGMREHADWEGEDRSRPEHPSARQPTWEGGNSGGEHT